VWHSCHSSTHSPLWVRSTKRRRHRARALTSLYDVIMTPSLAKVVKKLATMSKMKMQSLKRSKIAVESSAEGWRGRRSRQSIVAVMR